MRRMPVCRSPTDSLQPRIRAELMGNDAPRTSWTVMHVALRRVPAAHVTDTCSTTTDSQPTNVNAPFSPENCFSFPAATPASIDRSRTAADLQLLNRKTYSLWGLTMREPGPAPS